jgi:hypothetical protein
MERFTKIAVGEVDIDCLSVGHEFLLFAPSSQEESSLFQANHARWLFKIMTKNDRQIGLLETGGEVGVIFPHPSALRADKRLSMSGFSWRLFFEMLFDKFQPGTTTIRADLQ